MQIWHFTIRGGKNNLWIDWIKPHLEKDCEPLIQMITEIIYLYHQDLAKENLQTIVSFFG